MYRKRKWAAAGILALALACKVHGETINMGGFQIEVGQKQDSQEESRGGNSRQQKNGQIWQRATETPEGNPVESSGEISEEYPDTEYQGEIIQRAPDPITEVWEPEIQWGAGGGAYDPPISEEIIQIYEQPEEGSGAEDSTGPSDSGQQIEVPEPEKKETKVPEAQTEEKKRAEERKETEETDKGEQKTARQEGLQFIHGNFSRLGPGTLPVVRLRGRQEVCLVSYAVNRQECGCRWEGDQLVPVDPPLRKGVNCLEISVFSEEGKVISMEPWYFSCGAGTAML